MSYEEITFSDPNPVKRWLQRQRLLSAVSLCSDSIHQNSYICDFGAGNGELCKLLSSHYAEVRLTCYEPTPSLLSEARSNLKGLPNVTFIQNIKTIPPDYFDAIFCLEVFEHLPPEETYQAVMTIYSLAKPESTILIGVPVEIGIPALYKGIFRMFRRYGAFDATINNIARSFLYFPPSNRTISEISPGIRFYHEHVGFDFRALKKLLKEHFNFVKVSASPFSWIGSIFMPEIYFVLRKTAH